MTSAEYAVAYLDPRDGALLGALPGSRYRFEVAGALSALTRMMRNGFTPATAQASLAAFMKQNVRAAAAEADNPAINNDFKAITGP